MSDLTKKEFEQYDDNGQVIVKGTIEGVSELPFWGHDLKLKAVKALLETVDRKDFFEDGKEDVFFKEIEEIEELINAIKY